jgi:hypothetical protein
LLPYVGNKKVKHRTAQDEEGKFLIVGTIRLHWKRVCYQTGMVNGYREIIGELNNW